MDDVLKEFVVEALELTTNVDEHLLRLRKHPDDTEALNALFRAFHTIKGGAGFMNLTSMVTVCHLTENLFDALKAGNVAITPAAIKASLQANDFVADQLTALGNGAEPDGMAEMPASLEEILAQALDGIQQPLAEMADTADTADSTDTTHLPNAGHLTPLVDWEALYQAVTPAGTLENDSSSASTGVETTSDTTSPETNSPESLPAEIIATDAAPSDTALPAVSSRVLNVQIKEDSIRVDAVKLDALLEVAGESVQAANQAAVLLEKLLQFKFDDAAATLISTLTETLGRASRYSTELQRATLSTRMQPVGRLFQKFPRLVRELAKDLGKEVELIITGAETEVDRVVVDSLYDPLVHMLRNALDHGLESTEERIAAGKPAKATISLKAWQEANSVMIQLADDGKGMNPRELRKKAVAKGLISESAVHTPEEAFQLVFLPGFSTRDVVSRISGRGVGMDVVKNAVEKHRGSIGIESHLGIGTCFSIRLPIELSIVPTMLVRTAGAILAMPMAAVQRVVELPENFLEVGGAPMLRDQGQPLRVLSLGTLLGYAPQDERIGIVVAAPHPYILALESVEGTAEMMIKPLTALPVPGITGTARSAEGELVLVLDLSFLLDGCKIIAAIPDELQEQEAEQEQSQGQEQNYLQNGA